MFDPLGVPRVGELIGEIDVWEKEKKAEGNEGGSGEGGKRVQGRFHFYFILFLPPTSPLFFL